MQEVCQRSAICKENNNDNPPSQDNLVTLSPYEHPSSVQTLGERGVGRDLNDTCNFGCSQ